MRLALDRLPAGDRGIKAILKAMERELRAALKSPYVRTVAEDIVSRYALDAREPADCLHAVFSFLRTAEYVPNPTDAQMLKPVADFLGDLRGSCAEHAVTAAALASLVGVPFVGWLVLSNGADVDHVVTLFEVDGQTVAVDPTEGEELGEIPAGMDARMFYPVKLGQFRPGMTTIMTAAQPARVRLPTFKLAPAAAATQWAAGRTLTIPPSPVLPPEPPPPAAPAAEEPEPAEDSAEGEEGEGVLYRMAPEELSGEARVEQVQVRPDWIRIGAAALVVLAVIAVLGRE
jgi:hypothetical protein